MVYNSNKKMENVIEQYTYLVKSVASKYKNCGVSFEDLVQEGLLGLLEAKEKFKPNKGVKFSTYAFYWIKKKITKAIEKNKKESLHIEIKDIKDVSNLSESSDKISEGSRVSFDMFESLPELEREILKLLFEESKTLNEISYILGIPRERVRQLKQKALRRLRIKKLTEN